MLGSRQASATAQATTLRSIELAACVRPSRERPRITSWCSGSTLSAGACCWPASTSDAREIVVLGGTRQEVIIFVRPAHAPDRCIFHLRAHSSVAKE